MQSNGHGSTLIYALLHLAGYEAFPIEQVRAFRELGSHTPGHPEYEPAHGVEVTTGPLGQGIANAAGMEIGRESLVALLEAFTLTAGPVPASPSRSEPPAVTKASPLNPP